MLIEGRIQHAVCDDPLWHGSLVAEQLLPSHRQTMRKMWLDLCGIQNAPLPTQILLPRSAQVFIK